MRWGRTVLIAIALLGVLAALLLLIGRPGASDGVSIALPPPATQGDEPLPPVTAARGANPPLVVIDAGHGGRDPGASSALDGTPESRVTLALAIAMRDALAATGRVRVALTRSGDTYIALEDRYEIARRLGADMFISVHADVAPQNDQARGATVYTLSEVASDREAAALAQRENEANRLGAARMSGDPNVNLILIDLAQRESMNRAADFARLLHREAAPIFTFRP
ncbi:MAG: N-acetylmuramoyl-L-alanine amidase, partial [Sphingomonas sp.]